MKIVLCQTNPLWENPEGNIMLCDKMIDDFCLKNGIPDIFVLPEFFTTGFTMNTSFAETESGHSVRWMKNKAVEKKCAIAASLPVKKKGKVYNSLIFVSSEGYIVARYDKRHLFSVAGEDNSYSPGIRQCIFEYMGWKIALSVCYDMRFPVWTRNVGKGYDLMINVANWPSVRIDAAEILSRARAVENVCYFAFCNRKGTDPLCEYNGHSMIIDSKGNSIGEEDKINGIDFIYADLDILPLTLFREKFPVWADADDFEIKL